MYSAVYMFDLYKLPFPPWFYQGFVLFNTKFNVTEYNIDLSESLQCKNPATQAL